VPCGPSRSAEPGARVGGELDQALALHLSDGLADRLAADTGAPRNLGGAGSVSVQMREDERVRAGEPGAASTVGTLGCGKPALRVHKHRAE